MQAAFVIYMLQQQCKEKAGDQGAYGDAQQKIQAVEEPVQPQREQVRDCDGIDAQGVEQDGAAGGAETEKIKAAAVRGKATALIIVEKEDHNGDKREEFRRERPPNHGKIPSFSKMTGQEVTKF